MIMLSTAIKRNALSLAQEQNTYKQNVVAINTQITSVLTSRLPSLNTPPPDWQDFINAYEKANTGALKWVNNVMGRLLDVPDEVQDYNSVITLLLQDAKTQASTLVSNPSNAAALQILNNDLTQLSNQFNLVSTFISGCVQSIQNFHDNLPELANQLSIIATKSTKDAKADQQQIDALLADITKFQNDIKSLTAAIIALGIADAAAITLGLVATIAAWPFGAVVWLVLGPAVAVATTYIALDAEKIKADKAKIEADQKLITGITADVAVLHALAKTYTDLTTQTTEIERSLQAVLAEWQQLESDINAAITDIRTATAGASSSSFEAVLNDITDAISEWNAAYVQAGALHLDLQVNTAQLSVGMSENEVKNSLGTGTSMSIIAYYNQLNQAV